MELSIYTIMVFCAEEQIMKLYDEIPTQVWQNTRPEVTLQCFKTLFVNTTFSAFVQKNSYYFINEKKKKKKYKLLTIVPCGIFETRISASVLLKWAPYIMKRYK